MKKQKMKYGKIILGILCMIVLIACGKKDDDSLNITKNMDDTSIWEDTTNFDVSIVNDMSEEDEKSEKIPKTEIVDFMKNYSYDIIKGGEKIYYSNVATGIYGFRNNEEVSMYRATNMKEYSVFFYSQYETYNDVLGFGIIVYDMDFDNINAGTIVLDNGTETVEYISTQIESRGEGLYVDILAMKDSSSSADLDFWLKFFQSDTMKITVKQTTGDEFMIDMSSDTIRGARAQLEILKVTMEAAF